MVLAEDIQSAVKSKKAILGYEKSLEYLRSNKPKVVVIADNIQKDRKEELEHDARLSETDIEVFDGSSKELGIICGKPFPVSALVIIE